MVEQSLQKALLCVSPVLLLSLGGLLVLLLGTFRVSGRRIGVVTAGVLLASLYAIESVWELYSLGQTVFSGLVFADPLFGFSAFVLSFGALLVVLLCFSHLDHEGIESPGEFFALLLFSTAGSIVFASSAEFVTLFVGLELMSLAAYCLCGSNTSQKQSAESALKYFLLGSFGSAFFLFGIAFLYGATGTTFLPSAFAALSAGSDSYIALLGAAFVLFGVTFKLALFPFHFWAPDVYEGAPTSVTIFMASVVKAAAVIVGLRVLWGVLLPLESAWQGVLWTLAFFTIIFGNLAALRQRSVKRMLAYSSLAHAGYMSMAFLAPGGIFGGGAALLYYIVAYTFLTIGSFGVVFAVRSREGAQTNLHDVTLFNGLSGRDPLLAALMALFMFGLAGLPPGMAGLLGKLYVFSAAVKAGFVGLVVVGVLFSVVSCFYYLRIIVAMYFVDADDGEEIETLSALGLRGMLVLCGVMVVLLGIFPELLYDSFTLMIP